MRPLYDCVKEKKSKADEMFEKLGYKKLYENEYEIKYIYENTELGDNFTFIVLFSKKAKIIWHRDTVENAIGIDIKLLQAINEKVKELGWEE